MAGFCLKVSPLIVAALLMLADGSEAQKKLSHPALTGTAEITLNVLYW